MPFRQTQRISATGVVHSSQSLTLGGASTDGRALSPAVVAEAGEQYWAFLRRVGLGVLRVRTRPDGGADLALPGLRLLAFGAPRLVEEEGCLAVRYPIQAGAVVQRQGYGQGYLQIGLGPEQLSMVVEGYHAALVGPRRHPLRVALYLATQSFLHVLVARRFLGLLRRRMGR